MAIFEREADTEPPTQPENFADAALYIKLKANLDVIIFLGWGEFMQQYQFNELEDRISKLKKRSKRHQFSGGNSHGVRW